MVRIPYRLFLIDRHPAIRAGLAGLIKARKDFTLCGEAGTATEARSGMRKLKPDVVVLGLVLDGRLELELLKELHRLHPVARFLVYSAQPELVFGRRALRAGAHGYLMKTEGLSTVEAALRAVAQGERYTSAILTKLLIEEGLGRRHSALHKLSNRELEVLKLLAQGHVLRELAAHLHLSVKTIGTYSERLKIKLGVNTARELVSEAQILFGH